MSANPSSWCSGTSSRCGLCKTGFLYFYWIIVVHGRSRKTPAYSKTLPAMFKKMKANDEVTILTCENGVTFIEREPAANFQKLESAVKVLSGDCSRLESGYWRSLQISSTKLRSGAVNRVVFFRMALQYGQKKLMKCWRKLTNTVEGIEIQLLV